MSERDKETRSRFEAMRIGGVTRRATNKKKQLDAGTASNEREIGPHNVPR